MSRAALIYSSSSAICVGGLKEVSLHTVTDLRICRVSTAPLFTEWSSCVKLLACFFSVGGRCTNAQFQWTIVWKLWRKEKLLWGSTFFFLTDWPVMCCCRSERKELWEAEHIHTLLHTYTPLFSTFAHEGVRMESLSSWAWACLYIDSTLLKGPRGFILQPGLWSGRQKVFDWAVAAHHQPQHHFHSFWDLFFEGGSLLPSGTGEELVCDKSHWQSISHDTKGWQSASQALCTRSIYFWCYLLTAASCFKMFLICGTRQNITRDLALFYCQIRGATTWDWPSSTWLMYNWRAFGWWPDCSPDSSTQVDGSE